jgi:hypothetical protein
MSNLDVKWMMYDAVDLYTIIMYHRFTQKGSIPQFSPCPCCERIQNAFYICIYLHATQHVRDVKSRGVGDDQDLETTVGKR